MGSWMEYGLNDRVLKKALNSFGFVGSGYSRKTEIFESGIYEIDSIWVCTYYKAIKREVVTKLFSSIFVHSFRQFGGVLF